MPLSRGTAACGFIALMGMLLAVGIKLKEQVPPGMMVDWEGILRPQPDDFIGALKPWLYPARTPVNEQELDALPDVKDTFPTLRKMIEGLNFDV